MGELFRVEEGDKDVREACLYRQVDAVDALAHVSKKDSKALDAKISSFCPGSCGPGICLMAGIVAERPSADKFDDLSEEQKVALMTAKEIDLTRPADERDPYLDNIYFDEK